MALPESEIDTMAQSNPKHRCGSARDMVDAAAILNDRGYRLGPKVGKVSIKVSPSRCGCRYLPSLYRTMVWDSCSLKLIHETNR